MIKGVNKNIIEVSQPDSIYFEKAVFYLRPNVRLLPAEITEREIGRCLDSLDSVSKKKRESGKLGRIIIYSLILITICAVFILAL